MQDVVVVVVVFVDIGIVGDVDDVEEVRDKKVVGLVVAGKLDEQYVIGVWGGVA